MTAQDPNLEKDFLLCYNPQLYGLDRYWASGGHPRYPLVGGTEFSVGVEILLDGSNESMKVKLLIRLMLHTFNLDFFTWGHILIKEVAPLLGCADTSILVLGTIWDVKKLNTAFVLFYLGDTDNQPLRFHTLWEPKS